MLWKRKAAVARSTSMMPGAIEREKKRPDASRADGATVTRVAYLVGYLRRYRTTPAQLYQQPEYEELQRIGRDLNERGGLDLMRRVAHQMAPRVTAPPNPSVGDQVSDSLSDINGYWHGIGDWEA